VPSFSALLTGFCTNFFHTIYSDTAVIPLSTSVFLALSLQLKALKEPVLRNVAGLKTAYAAHVLGGSSGNSALLVLADKVNGVRTRGRPSS